MCSDTCEHKINVSVLWLKKKKKKVTNTVNISSKCCYFPGSSCVWLLHYAASDKLFQETCIYMWKLTEITLHLDTTNININHGECLMW